MKPLRYIVVDVRGGIYYDAHGFATKKAADKKWREINREQDRETDSLFTLETQHIKVED